MVTVSWRRPLRRRRLMISRPALVLMRLRNPWVRSRDFRCGWNVRFTGLLRKLGANGRGELAPWRPAVNAGPTHACDEGGQTWMGRWERTGRCPPRSGEVRHTPTRYVHVSGTLRGGRASLWKRATPRGFRRISRIHQRVRSPQRRDSDASASGRRRRSVGEREANAFAIALGRVSCGLRHPVAGSSGTSRGPADRASASPRIICDHLVLTVM
jgi:hypothetical protein